MRVCQLLCRRHKPHLRWDFPQEFLAYIPENVSNAKYDAWPDDIPHLHWHECAEMSVGGMWNSQGWGVPPPSKEYQMHARRAYYAAIAYADSLIGQLLDELDAQGLTGETTVAFIAGEEGAHAVFTIGAVAHRWFCWLRRCVIVCECSSIAPADHGWSVYEGEVRIDATLSIVLPPSLSHSSVAWMCCRC